MVKRNLNPIAIVALLFVFAASAYASCAVVDRETAELYARQDGLNLLMKGFFLGLVVSMYLFNAAWFIVRTNRWISAILLSLLTLPFVFGFWMAEIISSECGFAGIDAKYYLVPLSAFVLLWLAQLWWAKRNNESPSIFVDL